MNMKRVYYLVTTSIRNKCDTGANICILNLFVNNTEELKILIL